MGGEQGEEEKKGKGKKNWHASIWEDCSLADSPKFYITVVHRCKAQVNACRAELLGNPEG